MIKKYLIALFIILVVSHTLNAQMPMQFVQTTLGYSYQSVKQNDKKDSFLLANELGKSGYNFDIGLGYGLGKNMDLVLRYQRIFQDEVDLNNFYLQGQYKHVLNKEFIPFLGFNFGRSQLKWSKKPINTLENDYRSSSWLVGLSVGFLNPVSKNMSIVGEYLFNAINHKTLLESATEKSELNHSYTHSFNFGLRVLF